MNREKLLKHIRDNCQIGCVALPIDENIRGFDRLLLSG